jgi:hypothetical protein
MKRNTPIAKSLKAINVKPEYMPMPTNRRITPAESVIDAACSRDQKSGNLYVPKAPIITKNDPDKIKAQHKTSIIIFTASNPYSL